MQLTVYVNLSNALKRRIFELTPPTTPLIGFMQKKMLILTDTAPLKSFTGFK
jgi:hypothetical protein